MDRNSDLYKVGLALHGHKCPAMPLGLRAGLAAMEALGVEHAPDGQLTALVEMDRNHCSTCFADGVQVATGCTFGKGNIRSLGYGKFALTLIDNKTSRSVRVIPTVKTMRRNQESEFLGLRKKGTPASQIDPALSEPLTDAVLSDPVDALFKVGYSLRATCSGIKPGTCAPERLPGCGMGMRKSAGNVHFPYLLTSPIEVSLRRRRTALCHEFPIPPLLSCSRELTKPVFHPPCDTPNANLPYQH